MKTSAFVDGVDAGEFMVTVNGMKAPMAFVAPLRNIGMSGVGVRRFAIWDGLHN